LYSGKKFAEKRFELECGSGAEKLEALKRK